jgi:hypothetical protein
LLYRLNRIGEIFNRLGCHRIACPMCVGGIQVELPNGADPLFSQDGASEAFEVHLIPDHTDQLNTNMPKN